MKTNYIYFFLVGAVLYAFFLIGCDTKKEQKIFESYKKLSTTDSIPTYRLAEFDSVVQIKNTVPLIFVTHYHPKSLESAKKMREANADFELFSLDYPSTNAFVLQDFYAQNKELIGFFKRLPTKEEVAIRQKDWHFRPNWAVLRKEDSIRWVDLATVDWTTSWWK